MTPRLKEKYKNEIIKNLMSKLNQKNMYSVPKIKKIVINMGLGGDGSDKKILKSCIQDISAITGQHPIVTKFKKSISNFKLREGVQIGIKVTMRGNRMYEFWERLVCFALPRVRDFKGLSPKAFDGRGNYTIGLKEQLIFPEINFDKIEKIKGMNITITTSAKNDEQGRSLLTHMGLPLRK